MLIRVDAARPAPRHVEPAVRALKKDGVILYPTDTGYAFGCVVSSAKGITRLRRLKGLKDKDPKPLTMMVSDLAEVGRYGHMGNRAFRTIRRLLPGPYTIVLPATNDVPRGMRNRNREVGVRIPDHPLCAMLVDAVGEPLLTGSVTSADVEFELEDPEDYHRLHGSNLDVVIDAGPLWPDPSTVLHIIEDEIIVLREGQGALP